MNEHAAEPRRVAIVGTGSYTPERVVDNDWFTQYVDTSDEWIVQRTGITQRRFAREDEHTSDMAAEAGRRALADANWKPEEVDFLLVGTSAPDTLLPNTSQYVHELLGLRRDCGATDMVNACSSYTYALSIATSLVRSGQADKVLVVGADKLSAITNFRDRTNCILFGDAAGATCLAPAAPESTSDVLVCRYGTAFDYESLNLAAGGSRHPASHETVEKGDHFIRMHGRVIYKFAVNTLINEINGICEQAKITLDDLDYIIPHQVNIRVIHSAMETLGIEMDRVFVNLHKYGNTAAASAPTALDEAVREGRIKRGDLIVLCAFGAGTAWGSQLIRW